MDDSTNNNKLPEFAPPTEARKKLTGQWQALNKEVTGLMSDAEVQRMADDIESFLKNRAQNRARKPRESSLL